MIKSLSLIIVLTASSLSFASINNHHDKCTYKLYKWNTKTRKSDGPFLISKKKSELKQYEKGMLGCTVCEEDQKEVTLVNNLKFKVCKNIADEIKEVLDASIAAGNPIESVEGYQVKMTRGYVDRNHYRTMFSNHAYGVAIDINRDHNGLYNNCHTFNEKCRLSHGGKWSHDNKLSLKADSKIVQDLDNIDMNWGGEILGLQKDFMHFSPTGY